jgi:hypothetical protein
LIGSTYHELLDNYAYRFSKHYSIITQASDNAVSEHAINASMRMHALVVNILFYNIKPNFY